MRSHELLRDLIQNYGAKALAADLGLSVPRVYQWAEPPAPEGGGSPNPLDRVGCLIRTTRDDRIADWICLQAQGFFVSNAKPPDLSRAHLMKATEKLIKQYAEMLSLVSTVVVDGQITEDEASDLRNQWQKIQAVTETYVRECENGSYRPPSPKKPSSLKKSAVKR